MLSIGQNVTLKTQLFYGNANVSIDPRMSCISGQYVPQGATGVVKEMNASEVLVEFYWNLTGSPGMGNTALLWLKRVLWRYLEATTTTTTTTTM